MDIEQIIRKVKEKTGTSGRSLAYRLSRIIKTKIHNNLWIMIMILNTYLDERLCINNSDT